MQERFRFPFSICQKKGGKIRLTFEYFERRKEGVTISGGGNIRLELLNPQIYRNIKNTHT